METKERIIELVRQNVISMEEALDLLEAAGHEQMDTFFSEAQEATTEHTEATDETYEEEAVSQATQADEQQIEAYTKQIDSLTKQIDTKAEALVIAEQRIREFEILAEIDPLTEEMQEQVEQLKIRQYDLDKEITALYEELDEAKNQRAALQRKRVSTYTEDVKEFFERNTEKVTDTASQFGQEGKRLGKWVKGSVQDFMDNFKMRDIQFNMNIPWIKESEQKLEVEVDAGPAKNVKVRIPNGSLDIHTHEAEHIYLAGTAQLYGNFEQALLDSWENGEIVSVDEQEIYLDFESPRVLFKGSLWLPKRAYQSFVIENWNGDIQLDQLTSESIKVNSKNGNITVTNSEIEHFESQQVNGNALLNEVAFAFADIHTYNGDIRVINQVNNIDAQTLAGSIYITKRVPSDANMNLKTVSGDIKVSVPGGMNVRAYSTNDASNIKSRLANASEEKADDTHVIQRFMNSDASQANIHTSQVTGALYLKDAEDSE